MPTHWTRSTRGCEPRPPQWAIDQEGFSTWEVFGRTDGARQAQALADMRGETQWLVTFFGGRQLVSAASERDARRDFLFSIGELA